MPKPPNKPMFSATVTGTVLELLVYEEIGRDWWSGEGVSALDVAAAIKAAGDFDSILVRINSPGGSAFEGVTIYNLLRSQAKPIEVIVDGMAASAASVVAMAGDTIKVGLGAMLMIHNAMWGVFGDANVLRKAADDIENISVTIAQIYCKVTGKLPDEIKALMDAETWMSADQAIELGFATEVLELDDDSAAKAKALTAQFNLKGFRKVPAELKSKKGPRNESVNPDCECDCPACTTIGCSGCENDPCEAAGCDCPNHEEEMSGPSLFLLKARQRLRERS